MKQQMKGDIIYSFGIELSRRTRGIRMQEKQNNRKVERRRFKQKEILRKLRVLGEAFFLGRPSLTRE
jgi:hypothetical protein